MPASRPECMSTSVTTKALEEHLDDGGDLEPRHRAARVAAELSSLSMAERCARADPEAPRHGRQPAEAGRRAGEGAGDLRGGARRRARGRARGLGRARSSRSGSPTSNGSLENLLHPCRLQLDVVVGGGGARREVRARQRGRLLRARRSSASSSSGSTRTPASGVTNSGGPPTRVATTERADAIASSVASPNGSTRLGWQTTSEAAIQAGTVVVAHAAGEPIPGRPSSAARSGPSPTNVSVPSPRRSNARASRRTFFRSESAPRQRNAVPSALPADLGAAPRRVARREALEVDAAVDDLGLPARLRHGCLEPVAEPARHRDDRCGAAHDVPRRCARARGVAPTFATSWPWAVTTSGARDASAAIRPAGTRKCA